MAVKYVRGVGGNWNTDATWSTTSGGAADTTKPTAADEARCDANSGQLTIDAAGACRQLDCTGYTNTLTHNNFTISVGDGTAATGNIAVKLVAGMTYTPSATGSLFSYVGTSGTAQTFDSGGKNMAGLNINSNGGTLTLAAALTATAVLGATVAHVRGTFNTANFAVAANIFSSNGTLTRTLTLGSTVMTLNWAGTGAFQINSSTGLTITANTAVTEITGTGGGFNNSAANLNFNGMSLTFKTGTGHVMDSIGCTLANVTKTGAAGFTDSLTISNAFTVTTLLTITGNSLINRVYVISNTLGTARAITLTGATATNTNCDYRDITYSGTPTQNTTSVGDGGGNTGITFTAAVTRYGVVAGNFSLTATWSTTSGGGGGASVPIVHDTIILDANSAAGTYTNNLARTGPINCTGFTRTLAMATVGAGGVYGSLTLSSGMTLSGTTQIGFLGRGSFTFTTAGKTITFPWIVSAGTITLADAHTTNYNGAGAIQVNLIGTLNDGGQTVAVTGANATVSFSSSLGAFVTCTGTWNLSATGAVTVLNCGAGVTYTTSAMAVVIVTTSASTRIVTLATSQTIASLTYTVANSAGQLTVTGSSAVITAIHFSDATTTRTLALPTSNAITFVTFDVFGRSGALCSLTGDVRVTSGIVTVSYLAISNSDATGGAQFFAGHTSTNGGSNTGWVFGDLITGVLAAPLGSLTGAMTATITHVVQATLAAPLGALVGAMTGTVTVAGVMSAPLGVLVGSIGVTTFEETAARVYATEGILGCSETYNVFIADRSGRRLLVELDFTMLTWERVLSGTSEGSVEIKGLSGTELSECCRELEDVDAWSNELHIYRNAERVWSGPITHMTFSDEGVEIQAEDISAWLGERRLHNDHNHRHVDLGLIFGAYVSDAMSVDNEPGLTVSTTRIGAVGTRRVKSGEHKNARSELDELARTGVEWTMIDREMRLFSSDDSLGSITLWDDHIRSDISVEVDGNMATEVIVTGAGNSEAGAIIKGTVQEGDASLVDRYGVHEKVASESSIQDSATAFVAARNRQLRMRRPAALFTGGDLEPSFPMTLDQIVPGLEIDAKLGEQCRAVRGLYRLTKVAGKADAATDTISISVQPPGGTVESS